MNELSSVSHLAVADQFLQRAVRSLNDAALAAPTVEARDHAKAIAVRVLSAASDVYALSREEVA